MATLMNQSEVESEPAEKWKVADSKKRKLHPQVLLAVAALLAGLSIAVPAAVMVLIYPLAPAEFHYVGGVWEGDVWWSYVFAGMALSIGFGLVGIALAVGGEVSAHRTAAGQVAKTHPTEATRARVALSLAILDLILGPAAFVLFGVYAGTAAAIAFGLTGIVLAGRSRTGAYRVVEGPVVETLGVWPTRAKVGLAFALLILILGPVALGGVAVLTGVALSIGLGLVGVVLAVRSEREAYRTAEGLAVKASGGIVTSARVALSFALLILILGPVAFLITRVAWPDGSVAQWVELGLLGLGLAGIVVTVRPVATAASLTLPFAVVTLMMAPYASISLTSGDATLGRILIAVGLLGIAIGVGGVAASDPAAIRRWFLPFAIIAFVLALLGDALMFLGLALRGLSL